LHNLARALIVEDRVRQRERVRNALLIQLRADSLRDDVDEVILKVFRDARDERDADVCAEEEEDAADENAGVDVAELHRVFVDDEPEDLRIEQRENMIDGRQHERGDEKMFLARKVVVQQTHGRECTTPPRAQRRFLRNLSAPSILMAIIPQTGSRRCYG